MCTSPSTDNAIFYHVNKKTQLRWGVGWSSKLAQWEARQTSTKTEFNAKYPFRVIQGDAFWDHRKAGKGLHVAI